MDPTTSDILFIMAEYIDENPRSISNVDFEMDLIDSVKDLIGDVDDDYIDDALEELYETIIPMRSFTSSDIVTMSDSMRFEIDAQILHLSQLPFVEQRTEEWYLFRENLITASSAYKIFGSIAVQNQLIFEKCSKITRTLSESHVNVTSPMHWGQKYEPVSVSLYEDKYVTKVGLFGCIRHPRYSFLGASPDGINICETSSRYGRMLEIKNVVSRDIDGIPTEEYWIQMQIQLETCDLYDCDFLETKFFEYETENDSKRDGDFLLSEFGDRKGIIMYFMDSTVGNPFYVYKPIHMVEHEFDLWFHAQIEIYSERGMQWVKNIYWRLEEFSCSLVCRNTKWFEDNIVEMCEFWSIIEKERLTGHEHRAPKKRNTKSEEESTIVTTSLFKF
jgi:putative phage-type endonuclease